MRRVPGPTRGVENPCIAESEFGRRYVADAATLRGRCFDVVVVGAGASGCSFAARLCAEAAPGTTVLLLEAGGEAQDSAAVRVPNRAMGLWHSEVDWGFRSEAQRSLGGRRMELEQGKTLGGSTAINYMVWVRGQRGDFDAWEKRHGCAGWGYEGVRRHFEAVERTLSGGGGGAGASSGGCGFAAGHVVNPVLPEARAFVASAAACSVAPAADYNGAEQQAGAALTVCSADTTTATRLDAFNAFVTPLLARQRRGGGQLTVCSCAMALKVLFDSGSAGALPRARGVALELCDGKVLEVAAAREVVLACGALGTPQLLMLSGIGPAAQLRAHALPRVAVVPAVGEGLQDHGVCAVSLRLRARLPLLDGNNGIPGIAFFRSELDVARAARAAAAARDNSGAGEGVSGGLAGEPDVQLVLTSRVGSGAAVKAAVQERERREPRLKERGAPFERQYAHALAAGRAAHAAAAAGDGRSDAASIDTVLNRPQSRGCVRLRDADPHSAPHVDGRWLSHPDDIETQLCGLRKIRDILRQEPLATAVAEVLSPAGFFACSDAQLREHVRATQQSTWHYSCTARMGDTAREDVACDVGGCVKGVAGLRVCDCSLMPFVVAGNTNATALMMGDKLGLACARDLREGGSGGRRARL